MKYQTAKRALQFVIYSCLNPTTQAVKYLRSIGLERWPVKTEAEAGVIFVTGPPRSGTTLLARLLSGGYAYPMIAECSVITSMIKSHYQFQNYLDKPRYDHFIRRAEFLDDLFKDLIAKVIGNVEAGMERKRSTLILKDPELALHLLSIPALIRQPSRSICCVRDPRDVIASVLAVHRRQGRSEPIEKTINESYLYYHKIDEAYRTQDACSPIMVVRYEDVANVDVKTFQTLEGFCGYKLNGAVFEESILAFDKNDPFYVATYDDKITRDRIGAYKEELSSEERSKVEAAFAGVIYQYKY